MKTFIFSILLILIVLHASLSASKLESAISKISISGATRVQFADINEAADFKPIGNADLKKVEADLAKYNLAMTSKAFISKNGKYVLTFAKDADQKIKRILFIDGVPRADEVTSVSRNRIGTTTGEIQSISAMTTSGD